MSPDTFNIALGALGILGLGFLVRQAYAHYRLNSYKLRPNCLLTRYPIIVVSPNRGPKSEIGIYLEAHGYLVFPARVWNFPATFMKIQKHFAFVHVFSAQTQELTLSTSAGLKSQKNVSQLSKEQCLDLAISLAEQDFQCSH